MAKLIMHPSAAESWNEISSRIHVGGIPEWVVLTSGAAFYVGLIILASKGPKIHGEEPEDEIGGIEASLDQWNL